MSRLKVVKETVQLNAVLYTGLEPALEGKVYYKEYY
jgi:hypothetical protein